MLTQSSAILQSQLSLPRVPVIHCAPFLSSLPFSCQRLCVTNPWFPLSDQGSLESLLFCYWLGQRQDAFPSFSLRGPSEPKYSLDNGLVTRISWIDLQPPPGTPLSVLAHWVTPVCSQHQPGHSWLDHQCGVSITLSYTLWVPYALHSRTTFLPLGLAGSNHFPRSISLLSAPRASISRPYLFLDPLLPGPCSQTRFLKVPQPGLPGILPPPVQSLAFGVFQVPLDHPSFLLLWCTPTLWLDLFSPASSNPT